MNDLWLSEKSISLDCCSRKIFGFVTDGRFNLGLARCTGLGFVVGKPFLQLIQLEKRNQIHVLVRNPSSMQYRWARLIVIKL